MPDSKDKKINKKIATMFVAIVLFSSFSPIFSKKAEAFIMVDWVNFAVNAITSIGTHAVWVKEYVLDAVAYQVVDLIIQRMTASTVNWINSGFQGSPAYVTNPEAYFLDVGDRVAGNFIQNDLRLGFLCGPINARIRLVLTNNYSGYYENWQCTLTDMYGNMDDFINDFDRGGWNKFFELTQQTQNNPIGAYLMAEGTLANEIARKTTVREKELDWGKGFLSFKRCKARGNVAASVNPTKRVCVQYEPLSTDNPNPQCVTWEDQPDDVAGQITEDVCVGGEETVTPGSVIEGQLGEVLSIGGKKLAVADEINEIVSALLGQLVNKAIGAVGGGLRSLSRPDTTNENNETFTEILSPRTDDAIIEDYFRESRQNMAEVINTPTPNPYLCRDNPSLPECLPPPGDPNNTDSGFVAVCEPFDQACLDQQNQAP